MSLFERRVEKPDQNLGLGKLRRVGLEHLLRAFGSPWFATATQMCQTSEDRAVSDASPEPAPDPQRLFDREMGEIVWNGEHVPNTLHVVRHTVCTRDDRFISPLVEPRKAQ